MLDLAGIEAPEGLSGESLAGCLSGADGADRPVFSEYHAQGMLTGGFMVKQGDFKYNYYVGHDPELFDLADDPGEFRNLAPDPEYLQVRSELHEALLEIADPEAVDAEARANQALAGERRGIR
jgi:choline-sulfatase